MPFVSDFFNFPSMLRHVLLNTSAFFVQLFGYETLVDEYTLYIVGGSGVKMVYSCIGYGYVSFLMALVLPYETKLGNKISLIVVGILLIFIVNVLRIGGLVILFSEGRAGLFHYIDHHRVLDLILYPLLILLFIVILKPFKK
jgi:exosortase/archaeosortase family protein